MYFTSATNSQREQKGEKTTPLHSRVSATQIGYQGSSQGDIYEYGETIAS